MKISHKILLAIIVSLGLFISLKLLVDNEKDPLTYYNNLASTKINIFRGWHIYPRDNDPDFMTFMCNKNQFENYSNLDSYEKEMEFYFAYDINENKIKFPHSYDSSEIKSLILYAKLLNIDTVNAKDSINLLVNEYLKSKPFRVIGAITPQNFISFDFGKNGNISLLYIPEEADNEQKIRMTKDYTIINKNWSYYYKISNDFNN